MEARSLPSRFKSVDEAAKAIANASEKFRAYDGYDLSQKYWEFVKQPLEEISV